MKSTADIRHAFLAFFQAHDHQIVESSSLVPANDPTLLFTNAGMVQFKDVFLGHEQRPYCRAVSAQRCVRAGGKHNDLENVGYTARHHTFFEMLGNFSFGDYFKRDAIAYAWQFLTQTLNLPVERLWVTVFEDDDEAAAIWLNDLKIDSNRFSQLGAEDNFWSMGATGPCGPCSEIFYDHGPDVPGGPPGTTEADGDRYVEIWNLVFMQYDRDAAGTLTPLPKPSVDTGMGLERIVAVIQGVHSNYDIDLFRGLVQATAEVVGCREITHDSLKVIADHIRSCAFLIVDGVVPSNEGQGYVLRRIIRRAVRHGYKLGVTGFFFYRLVQALAQQMGEAYPVLIEKKSIIETILQKEEARFSQTLENGMKILDMVIATLDSDVIPGDLVFKLYDTYGFPYDLTADIARERHLQLDKAGFDQAMKVQQEQGKRATQFVIDKDISLDIRQASEFVGYDTLTCDAQILALIDADNRTLEYIEAGQLGGVVLNQTPFYAESGGQVGDQGVLTVGALRFDIRDTQKLPGRMILHIGQMTQGTLKLGDTVRAEVDATTRHATELNHSATHLLHAALRSVLGDHVSQKGSRVDAHSLRFDFSHFEPVSRDQLQQIEVIVNTQIRLNQQANTDIMDLEAAKSSGAMALFGEKYDEKVRVLKIGDFSVELCGGTHVTRAGDIGLFKISIETGVASGIRRIEAITAANAIKWLMTSENTLSSVANIVKSDRTHLNEKVKALFDQNKMLEKELAQVKGKLAQQAGRDLVSEVENVNGVSVLAKQLNGVDSKSLRETVDQLKNKLGSAVVVLAAVKGQKVSLVAGVTKDYTKQLKAGDLVSMVAHQVGGKGGGRPDMAMAGGSQPENVTPALSSVAGWVRDRLTQN